MFKTIVRFFKTDTNVDFTKSIKESNINQIKKSYSSLDKSKLSCKDTRLLHQKSELSPNCKFSNNES